VFLVEIGQVRAAAGEDHALDVEPADAGVLPGFDVVGDLLRGADRARL
jgi:hypothetical protein